MTLGDPKYVDTGVVTFDRFMRHAVLGIRNRELTVSLITTDETGDREARKLAEKILADLIAQAQQGALE